MRARFVALVAFTLAACNAILGNESSITYVDDDATAPGRDGSAEGAGEEASTDGGREADAAAADGDAAFPPDTDIRCDAAIFCSDFDPPSPLDMTPYGWDSEYPSDSGRLDTTDRVTLPNSLRFDFPTNNSYRAVTKSFFDAGRPLGVYFDFFVRTSGGGALDLLEVVCKQAGNVTVRVKIDATGTTSLELGTKEVKGPVVPSGMWRRIVLTLDTSDISMFVVGPASFPVSLGESCTPSFVVSLGPSAWEVTDGGFKPWTVLFDKVRVTAP